MSEIMGYAASGTAFDREPAVESAPCTDRDLTPVAPVLRCTDQDLTPVPPRPSLEPILDDGSAEVIAAAYEQGYTMPSIARHL